VQSIRVVVVGFRSHVGCRRHGILSLMSPILFYPHPTTDAPLASLPISRLTLPPSMSSSESPPVVSDYTVKPHVTQFYSRRGARLSDVPASSDELSSNVPSSFFSLRMCHLLLLLSPPL
jgi:hypothetical protein